MRRDRITVDGNDQRIGANGMVAQKILDPLADESTFHDVFAWILDEFSRLCDRYVPTT